MAEFTLPSNSRVTEGKVWPLEMNGQAMCAMVAPLLEPSAP
jgi:hypothetical protein